MANNPQNELELEARARRRAAGQELNALIMEGVSSGDPVAVTPDDWEEIRQAARKQTAKCRDRVDQSKHNKP